MDQLYALRAFGAVAEGDAGSRMPRPGPRARSLLGASAVALLAFLVYLRTLAPTVTGEDGGELVSAAYTLGIAHPPGYPLWCLLGRLFIEIVPFGEVAWRVSLMSAFFAALTVSCVYLVARQLACGPAAAAAAALLLAFSGEFWEQSVIAEVYTLNSFLLLTCTLLLLRWRREARPSLLYAAALVYGLGLANHPLLVLAGPVFLGFVLGCAPAGAAPSLRSRAVAAALVLCGLGIYVYLPLRSLSDPAIDWGNPETLARIWDHVTLGQYRGIVSAPRGVARFLAQCWAFLGRLAGDFTPWLAWIPFTGVVVAAKRRSQDEIFLLALLASVFLGATLVSNFDVGFHAIEANSHHWIPSHLFLAILAGVAIDAAIRSLAPGRVVAFAAAAAVAASPLIANFRRNDMSRYFVSRDYGLNLLKTMAANAIYFPEGDYTVFPILYLQVVEGLRPDVTLASRYAYLDEGIYELMGEDPPTSLSDPRHWEETHDVIERVLESAPDRPVYSALRHPVATARVVQDGLLYRYLRPRERWQPDEGIWEFYDWHTLAPDELRGNWTAELILHDYLRARAIWLLGRNRAAEARPLVDEAHALSHGDPEAIALLGDVYAQGGLHDEALPFYREALASDPDRVDFLLALGRAALFAKRPGVARQAARRLEALAPERPDVQRFRERVRELPSADAP